jgi:hypothetical protein
VEVVILLIFVAIFGGWGIWVSGRGERADRHAKKQPDADR